MPRTGASVERFDRITDIESGEVYEVIYVSSREHQIFYLRRVAESKTVEVVFERELRQRFEKLPTQDAS
jgi:hypothetical protein